MILLLTLSLTFNNLKHRIKNLLKILTSYLLNANIRNPDKYIFITSISVEKSKTYNKAMSKTYA